MKNTNFLKTLTVAGFFALFLSALIVMNTDTARADDYAYYKVVAAQGDYQIPIRGVITDKPAHQSFKEEWIPANSVTDSVPHPPMDSFGFPGIYRREDGTAYAWWLRTESNIQPGYASVAVPELLDGAEMDTLRHYQFQFTEKISGVQINSQKGPSQKDLHDIWLYEGEEISLNVTNLPYDTSVAGKPGLESVNAIQGCAAVTTDDSVCHIVDLQQIKGTFTIEARASGDGEVNLLPLYLLGNSNNTYYHANNISDYTTKYGRIPDVKESLKIKVHVRPKPSVGNIKTVIVSKSATSGVLFDIPVTYDKQRAGSETTELHLASDNGDYIRLDQETLLCSSDTVKARVYPKAIGESKISITVSDETIKHRNGQPVEKTAQVKVKDIKIRSVDGGTSEGGVDISGIEDGGTAAFKDKKTLTFKFAEDPETTLIFTGAHPDLVNVTYKNGELTVTRRSNSEFQAQISGSSTSGNIFTFTVTAETVPDAPLIENISSAYGKAEITFGGALYDGTQVEIKSAGAFSLAADTNNRLVSIDLDKGNYTVRARNYIKYDGYTIYSVYSDQRQFSILYSASEKPTEKPAVTDPDGGNQNGGGAGSAGGSNAAGDDKDGSNLGGASSGGAGSGFSSFDFSVNGSGGQNGSIDFNVHSDINLKERIVPKTKFKKAARAGRKVKITLKRVEGASGYRVRYSYSKKFKKSMRKTIYANIKPGITLKKVNPHKKLYLKARVYKITDGRKLWSRWTKRKVLLPEI